MPVQWVCMDGIFYWVRFYIVKCMKKLLSIVFVCLSINAFAQPAKVPYKGGAKALQKWMNGRLRYPLQAKDLGIQGTVTVIFTIQEEGLITDVRTKDKSLGWGLEEEAIRLVTQMPQRWLPQARNKNKQHSLTIQFYYNELKCTIKIIQYQQRPMVQKTFL